MIQIPENVRPYLDIVLRHHFWMLLPLVPLLVIPLVVMANGRLVSEISAARSEIEGRTAALRGVEGIQPHPNDEWSAEIDRSTKAVKRETFAEWQRFWNEQKPLRSWPTALGADFVQRAETLKADGKLPRKLLERYQNSVRPLVRQLPKRMGGDDFMVDGVGAVDPNAGRPLMEGEQPRPGLPVQWSAEDQKKVYASFNWSTPPTTLQVLLAQEELWVYGVLCDSVARMNQGASGQYNAVIPLVEQLAVGYPAAEDDPGASKGGRIFIPTVQAGGGELPPQESFAPGDPAAGGRPPNPRFSGAGAPTGASPEDSAAQAPVGSVDDGLRNWIYVSFDGKPLAGPEVATSPDAMMSHLMPFVIRAVVDERKLDAWLVDLAKSLIPIDVRQVRVNPQAGAGGLPGGEFQFRSEGTVAATATARPYDVTVELRGTVGLATQPDPAKIGFEANDAGAGPEPAAPDGPPPAAPEGQPAAGGPVGPVSRRWGVTA